MAYLTILRRVKSLVPSRPTFQISKVDLNTRRKELGRRFRHEPRRRMSVIFENPNSNRALKNGPDYSFLDHRPTPYGFGQFKRICQSIEHTAKIIQCNKEIDLALQLEKMKAEEVQAKVQDILNRKLKPKGGIIKVKATKS